MSAGWTRLRKVLAALRAENDVLPLWWRDDDATEPTHALDMLEQASLAVEIPVHIAVIPDLAKPSLAEHICHRTHFVPLVHGWRHHNTAPEGAKKSEFGHLRRTGPDELRMAFDKMQSLFGDRNLPVFVPPWNRLDSGYLNALHPAGYRGLSTFAPRRASYPAPGVLQINTHIDPIDWHSTRDLKDENPLLDTIVDLLQARRSGIADVEEPLGLLTHHLVHTPPVWEFCARLLRELLDGGAQPCDPKLVLEFKK